MTPLWDKSIKENTELMQKCDGYEKEMQFIAANAHKNETKGLNVEKVVEVILQADKVKNPKLTYLIGKDAKFAHIFSMLPQGLVNKLVKLGLKLRMNRV